MRACKSSRLEAAKALDVSKKQRQIEVIVFFIFVFRSFPLRSPHGRGFLGLEEYAAHCQPRIPIRRTIAAGNQPAAPCVSRISLQHFSQEAHLRLHGFYP
jgi:hypothetical protein